MSSQSYTPQQFFEKKLIPDLKKMIAADLSFYAFSIMMQGVELAGNLLDSLTFHERRQATDRFKRAFPVIFTDPKYAGQERKFVSQLRGKMVHLLRPEDFNLMEEANGATTAMHMRAASSTMTDLVIDELLKDFETGLVNVWSDARLDSTKAASTMLVVTSRTIALTGTSSLTSQLTAFDYSTAHPPYSPPAIPLPPSPPYLPGSTAGP